MKINAYLFATAAVFAGSAAFAGGYIAPVVEEVVAEVVPEVVVEETPVKEEPAKPKKAVAKPKATFLDEKELAFVFDDSGDGDAGLPGH